MSINVTSDFRTSYKIPESSLLSSALIFNFIKYSQILTEIVSYASVP